LLFDTSNETAAADAEIVDDIYENVCLQSRFGLIGLTDFEHAWSQFPHFRNPLWTKDAKLVTACIVRNYGNVE
jgi:hypothetical protein